MEETERERFERSLARLANPTLGDAYDMLGWDRAGLTPKIEPDGAPPASKAWSPTVQGGFTGDRAFDHFRTAWQIIHEDESLDIPNNVFEEVAVVQRRRFGRGSANAIWQSATDNKWNDRDIRGAILKRAKDIPPELLKKPEI